MRFWDASAIIPLCLKEEFSGTAKRLIKADEDVVVWSEVQPTEPVRQRAERLLMLHPLKTADALQLSAALIWAEEIPKDQVLICLDHNLREAAQREGFTVLPEKF